MNSVFIGTIIGGLIGVVPTIATVVMNYRNSKQQRTHEIRLKKIEIYESARRIALEDFMYYLGAMSSSSLPNDFSVAKCLSAAKRACMYVSSETAKHIEIAIGFVVEAWNHGNPTIYPSQLHLDGTIRSLNEMIHDELRSGIYVGDDPAGSCKPE